MQYIDHHIQNEVLKILANRYLHKIARDIDEAGYFALESDVKSLIHQIKSRL